MVNCTVFAIRKKQNRRMEMTKDAGSLQAQMGFATLFGPLKPAAPVETFDEGWHGPRGVLVCDDAVVRSLVRVEKTFPV
jgi:hypothetical protein